MSRRVDLRRLRRLIESVLQAALIWSALLAAIEVAGAGLVQKYLASIEAELLSYLFVFLAVLLVPWWAATMLLPALWRRLRTPRLSCFDVTVLALLAFTTAAALDGARSLRHGAQLPHLFGALVLAGFLVVRFFLWMSSRSQKGPQPGLPLFDEILGEGGLAPLDDFSRDELERGTVLSAIEALVQVPRSASLSFGVEGAWGSGKTSLLKGLQHNLRRSGLTVVYFDAWAFREPDRIVANYFRQVRAAVQETAGTPGLGKQLRVLGRGLAAVGPSPVTRLLELLALSTPEDSVDAAREGLREALKGEVRPVVVMVDDLDRLETDEAHAALRAVKLVSDLPNLTHVLAYDREQLSASLFPADGKTSTRARDYLAKVVNVEFSIGSPPRDLAERLIGGALDPLLRTVDDKRLESFRERMAAQRVSVFTDALPTPREVRRVVAATGWVWERMSRHLNLFDLFVLTVIQYRFPSIYSTMRSHREWFTEIEWLADPWRITHGDAWEKEREQYLKALIEDPGREAAIAKGLLGCLFSNLGSYELAEALGRRFSVSSGLSEETARVERRLIHPDIFDRYFHLYVPASSVAEAEIEEFVNQALKAADGTERQQLVRNRVLEEVKQGRIHSFFNQWDVGFKGVLASPPGTQFLKDVALGLAACSEKLVDLHDPVLAPAMRLATYKVMRLAASTTSDDEASELLAEVIRRSPLIGFSEGIVFYASNLESGKEIYGDRKPDPEQLRKALDARLRTQYSGGGLLVGPKPDLVAAVFRAGDRDLISAIIKKDLQNEPQLLVNLLSLVIHASPDPWGGVEVWDAEPGVLQKYVSIEMLHEETKHLELGTWVDPADRKKVELFRGWVESSEGTDTEGRQVQLKFQ